MTSPSADAQIVFLRNVQRLLGEGIFADTYRFAVLHALADLSLLRGDDTGAPLTVSTVEISGRVAELYWFQAAPYSAGSYRHELLLQTSGGQSAIVRTLIEARERSLGSLWKLRRDARAWAALVGRVDRVVREAPLWRLQTLGGECLDFLYANAEGETSLTLRPGVAWCLRAHHGLVTELVRSAWLRFVRRHNPGLDVGADLASFLFGAEASETQAFVAPLRELQSGKCFYCGRPVARDFVVVDHFVPRVRYPADLGHNLVLAHRLCNRRKSDLLAAEVHLERWVERNARHGHHLTEAFIDAGLPCDLDASRSVARWAYAHTARAGGQVWERGDDYGRLSGAWERLLAG